MDKYTYIPVSLSMSMSLCQCYNNQLPGRCAYCCGKAIMDIKWKWSAQWKGSRVLLDGADGC